MYIFWQNQRIMLFAVAETRTDFLFFESIPWKEKQLYIVYCACGVSVYTMSAYCKLIFGVYCSNVQLTFAKWDISQNRFCCLNKSNIVWFIGY